MRYRVAAVAFGLLASAAHASDTPLYQPAAAWVEVADAAKAMPLTTGPLVIQDVQVRVDGDTVTSYVDMAFRIDTPQTLTQAGTLSAVWLPDKGDLTIHRATLLRAGGEIDLLKSGKFTVLRREEQLEQRTLTGILTATMPIAGARVGDVVRLSYSVSVSDKALAGQVQAGNVIPYIPTKPGIGRFRLSWPESRAIRVSAGPRFALPPPTAKAGFKQIEIPLPRPKPEEIPADAPARYRAPIVVELTSFTEWAEVSKTMAPLYSTPDTIVSGGPIAAEIAKIVTSSSDPVVRATAALRLVQDRIAYLANGMNGGNYVPQSPEKTWEARYGDCKAKTLLLLAMLRALQIDAEPVLVSTTRGDSLTEDLPLPAAFDHVLVRATVAGKELWLDGTGLGATRVSLSDAPSFSYALPVRASGAELIKLVNRAPTVPSVSIVNHIDLSAGIDFPALYDLRVDYSGQLGAMLQQASKLPAGKDREELIDQLVASVMGETEVYERSLSFDPASGFSTVRAKGIANSLWDRKDKRAEYKPNLLLGSLAFEANRSRAAWRDIPVALVGANRLKTDITVELPQLPGYSIEGTSLHAAAAGGRLDREAHLEGNKLHVIEELATSGGEVAPAEIAAERSRYAALVANRLRLQAPADAPRSWDKRGADPVHLRAIEVAYARLIAANPTEAGYLYGRASFFSGLRDHQRAISDLDAAVALDASADNFAARAAAKQAGGDLAGAVTDARKAAELDPGAARTSGLAQLMGIAGQSAAALPLIDQALTQAGDQKPNLIGVRAELLARLDRPKEGLEAMDALAGERPGDANVLNARCWFEGLWQIGLGQIAKDCDAAVNAADYSPAVLDSRALAQFRLGKFDAALADANAALGRNGGQDQTLLLRGIIRTKMGDAGGATDIGEALRRRPGLKAEYAGYGLLPKS